MLAAPCSAQLAHHDVLVLEDILAADSVYPEIVKLLHKRWGAFRCSKATVSSSVVSVARSLAKVCIAYGTPALNMEAKKPCTVWLDIDVTANDNRHAVWGAIFASTASLDAQYTVWAGLCMRHVRSDDGYTVGRCCPPSLHVRMIEHLQMQAPMALQKSIQNIPLYQKVENRAAYLASLKNVLGPGQVVSNLAKDAMVHQTPHDFHVAGLTTPDVIAAATWVESNVVCYCAALWVRSHPELARRLLRREGAGYGVLAVFYERKTWCAQFLMAELDILLPNCGSELIAAKQFMRWPDELLSASNAHLSCLPVCVAAAVGFGLRRVWIGVAVMAGRHWASGPEAGACTKRAPKRRRVEVVEML